ncbi:DNA-3-methyladenine glycosylase family protein [Paenibacillus farraposensis]|uniref:DNA-3-methyladenine glycosylase II n=1 Tax=Paenibacillus farraposensis TaxID=2807095 RepID=A0ABW4DKS1_9BACL|nr:DNA-3-methyladenine glycosylase 2 family protein [Paenibacillus farraposensis]MCC3378549.1 DNA-3-methyladenine glycosylase 2 family protein [Paenibacillus farraposensis]
MNTVITKNFDYGEKEIQYLKSADPVLGRAMSQMGKVERMVIPDLFTALVHAIVGQLVSAKAVETIWARMQEKLGVITPQRIVAHSAEDIQSSGITMKKAACIMNLAQTIEQGLLDLQELYELSDTQVIQKLSSLQGIGPWTAEMMLIHCMERPDVVSWGDMAIRRGMMKLYNLGSLTKKQFEEYRQVYSPYGSVASIYLWSISFR